MHGVFGESELLVMSMVYYLREVEEKQLTEVLRRPEYIVSLLYGVEPEPRAGRVARLLGINAQPAPAPECITSAGGAEIDIDKAWHGIHYLLTGSDWEGAEPLCYLISGGEEIGKVDVGYGPARGLSSQEVKKWTDALAKIKVEELKARFDAVKMMELDIYPTVWNNDPEEDDPLGYLLEYFEELRSFVKRAAADDKCIILYLA